MLIDLFHDNPSWDGWEIKPRSGALAGIIIGGGADGISSTSIIPVILLSTVLILPPVMSTVKVAIFQAMCPLPYYTSYSVDRFGNPSCHGLCDVA